MGGVRLLGRTDSNGSSSGFFETPLPRFNGSVRHRRPRTTLSAGLRVDPQFVSDTELDTIATPDPITGDTVTTTVVRDIDPIRIDIAAFARANRSIDTANSLSFDVTARQREFSETTTDFQPSTDVSAAVTWSHALDRVTGTNLTGRLRWFGTEDPNEPDTLTGTITAGYQTQATTRHSFSFNLGGSVLDEDRNGQSFLISGDAGLTYRLSDATYRLSVAQDLNQNDDGVLENVLQARANGTWRINDRNSLSMGALAFASQPIDTFAQTDYGIGLSANFNHRLTPDWNLNIGASLRLTQENERSGVRGSDRVFLRISRGFSILP
jgi:hypothetical protein